MQAGVPHDTHTCDQPRVQPIADHGLIGDLRSCALVDDTAAITWFCPGRFDAPSIFGALLDPDAGAWTLRVIDGDVATSQFYFPDSAVVITRFLTEDGVVEVHDFLPLLEPYDDDHRQRVVRRVRCVRGRVHVRMGLAPRPDYGRAVPEIRQDGQDVVRLSGGGAHLALTGTHPVEIGDDEVVAELDLSIGEEASFVLHVLDDADQQPRIDDVEELFDATTTFWRGWVGRSNYRGRWRETVHRSAITLKLLTHEPTGAVVAAPTTSLPEEIGGERNWDYRYVWIRDAGFTLYALLRLGYTDEAAAFMNWLIDRLHERKGATDGLGPLRNLYAVDGTLPVAETELDHLSGYCGSAPVRIGNAAVEQLQLDIYGELIDSVYLFDKYGPGISLDAWYDLVDVVDWLIEHWQEPDAGMWEIRDDWRPHTVSRLMCWVALERMIRMARRRGLPADLAAWSEARDAVHRRIMDECWDDDLGAFTQSEGSPHLDAGVLLMPMVKFLAPNDPKFLSTLELIEHRLVSDSLVFRYNLGRTTDGLDGPEGTFSLCSFWYVEALTRAGRLDDARIALEKMFTHANHLGLYAEQIGLTGQQLGNFPQAFTHLALISAATNLDRALDEAHY